MEIIEIGNKKIEKIGKPINILMKKTTKIRNDSGITYHFTEIKRIIREYYEYLYSNKLGNLDKMHKFLEIHNQSKLI